MEIKINNVSYTYNKFTSFQKTAIMDITLNIESEKITGIIGPTGSGKTTLIQMLNALLLPTSGNIKMDEFLIKNDAKLPNINELRRKVGLIFQFPEEQFFNPTVREEVSFALKHFNYKSDHIHKQVSAALKMVGLDDSYLERSVFNLSSGEKRKVAIASIMVYNPKVIIFDEPTVGLDYKSKKNLIGLIKRLKDHYHKTIIIVSHDVDMLNIIADNIVVLNKGEIAISGNKNDIFKSADIFDKCGLKLPKITEFTNKVRNKKGIILGRYTDIKDLIKEIYRHV